MAHATMKKRKDAHCTAMERDQCRDWICARAVTEDGLASAAQDATDKLEKNLDEVVNQLQDNSKDAH